MVSSKSPSPCFAADHGLLGKATSARLDEFLPLVDRLPVLGRHRAERLGDQAGDESRTEAATTRRGRCDLVDPVAENSGDVVGVVETMAPDDSRQKTFEVVVVRLGTSKCRRERSEGRRRDDRGMLLGGQPGTAEQVGEAVMLSFGGDRLEFGRQAVDAAVEFVLGLDRLGGGKIGTAVLEDAVQNGPGSDVIRLGGGVAVVGLVEGDRTAVSHARTNLATLPGRWEAVSGDVERVLARPRGDLLSGPVDLVVLDPPRQGARRKVVREVARRTPRRIAYVACDPAALARDTAYLREAGYSLASLRALDLFPMTHHVECVALFHRD